MLDHCFRISHRHECAAADVCAVGDQTKACKEREQIPNRGARSPDDFQEYQWKYATPKRAAPDDEERMRIIAQVGAGDRQRIEDDAIDAVAADPGVQHMAEFVDSLHC